MNRMGLVDFWCYDNEEFIFENGHMLLRGSNGSGKSVTLQSFIPLLLDGNKNSERLDTFGSRSRKMDTYLIDENSEREERIGYLYLEFKRADSDLYLTIGMGLRARKNKKIDAWYFVIEDNRRVNRDFSLMDNHLTLSQKQLKNILGDQVIDNQGDYMRKVNDALFGFENIDDYRDAINLLLQLRMPKLSNSLSPSKINEILEKSLQPISEEDLRPMSEAILNMDSLQDELASLKHSLSAAKAINVAYDTYNMAMLVDKWKKYDQEQQKTGQLKKERQAKLSEYQVLEQELKQLNQGMSENRIDFDIKRKEKSALMSQDLERLHEESMALKKEINDYRNQIEKKEVAVEQRENRVIDTKNSIQNHQNEYDQHERQSHQSLNELEAIYENYPLSEHVALKAAVSQKESYAFGYTKKYLKEELSNMDDALRQWQSYEGVLEKLSFFQDQISSCQEAMNIQERSIHDAQNTYKETIDEYNEGFYRYQAENEVLKLSIEDLRKMGELLSEYEDTKDYFTIHKIVQDKYFEHRKAFNDEKMVLVNEKQKQQEAYENTYQEWQNWLNHQEIEPDRDMLTTHNRQALKEEGVDYVPFFELLDFEEGISQAEKDRIEEMLSQMRLLDALVIEKKWQAHLPKNGHHDYYLWTQQPLKHLSTIKLSKMNDAQDLLEVFDFLGIEHDDSLILQENYFQSGVIQGSISGRQESLFIGLETRKKKKQQKLDELSQLLTSLQENLAIIDQKLGTLDHALIVLDDEYTDFKYEQDLKTALKLVEDEKMKYQQLIFQKMNMENHMQALNVEKQKIFVQLKALADQWLLKVERIAFENRRRDIEDYQNELDHFKDHYEACLRLKDQLTSEQNRLEELEDDLDTLKFEKDDLLRKKEICQGKKKVIDQQLDDMGYLNIKQQMSALENRLSQLEKDYQAAVERHAYCVAKKETLTQALEQWQKQIDHQESEERQYLDILYQELDYGLVLDKDISQENIDKTLKKIALEHPLKKTITEYQVALQKVFFDQSIHLVEYRPTNEFDELVHQKEDVSGHLLIKASRQGKKMPFGQLAGILEENIETQQLLINDKDREIFEDILVNTIGKKIRYRIQSSRRWVDKMERYMQAMNTSSGLQLSLRWKARKADSDGQLDTSRLVELLDKDYHVLKDSDREKISRHFRSKIEYARQTSKDEYTTASFHQLIKEVMDYRQWFDFTLYAKKPNEQRKELTNHIFGAYSGGEKAIVMYVPLFSAVAAKMESAREDAPLLIALDEAFAGVDENNIDNLFALIEKFGFDYIMNSQVLWGDYPSCKSLAIYELFRPNNDPFVTTVAYTWNGHIKQVKL